jgi:sulfoxide reductase heme-binding subunit YedZ
MKKARFTPLQIAVHVGAWIPLAWLAWAAYTGHLTVNPIQAATQRTGKYALVLLVLSLSATPLNTLFGLRQVLRLRRALGLYAFLYAGIHLAIFAGVDYGLDWSLLKGAIFEKPFVLVGLAALLILLSLAATSFRYWMKRLGKKWKRLHQLVYLAAALVIVHFAWSVKGDILRLQGNVLQPLAFGALVTVLLALRIPPVRKRVSAVRQRISRRSLRRRPMPAGASGRRSASRPDPEPPILQQ